MKRRPNHSSRASALEIILSVALLSSSAILLGSAFTTTATGGGPTTHRTTPMARELSFAASKRTSAREQNLTPPAGLKPAEQEAWLARAQRNRAPDGADPSWVTTGSLGTARGGHTATLLPSGKVLVVGGRNDSVLTGAELYDPATGSWSSTGSLGTARGLHTATLLPSGKVLVAGGLGPDFFALSSAELYDPATGNWASTGSLGTGLVSHTATLLPSGKVLVAAGSQDSGSVSSAELYDPATGSWSSTGSLGTARFFHTATLLPSGKVLVTGGEDDGGTFFSSAELYDPATGSWSSTGSLGTARRYHTATLLPSGKVLVVGGENISSSLSSAELYDPATGSWSSTGSLGTARSIHIATLLPSGKLLVAGGDNDSAELYDPATGNWSSTGSLGTVRRLHTATLLLSGKVLVAAGFQGSGVVSSAEIYDPAMGSWSSTGSLGTVRWQHTATLLPSGKVLVAGGLNGFTPSSSAEIYDSETGSWSGTGSLSTARRGHTATLLPSGKVLVAGGDNADTISPAFNSVELYDPATGSWSSTGILGRARTRHTATLLPSGKVLVVGGDTGDESSPPLDSAELYDPATATWTNTGSLNVRRESHTATLLPSGKVLVAGGGFLGSSLSTAELYDPATESWSTTGLLSTGLVSHTATLLPSGKVLVAAGQSASLVLSSAQLYDPATGTWSSTGSLTTARVGHTATLLPSRMVLVTGGGNFDGARFNSAELYDPSTGTWSSTGSFSTGRWLHTATLLPSGKMLIAGGNDSSSTTLGSAELYDRGLGFDPNWQPLLTTVSPSTLLNGVALTASGSRFKGISEASGGNSPQNSSSNYPLIQLLSLANEQTLSMPVDAITGWSDTSFTSTPITLMTTSSSGFPIGHALVTVFTNGIPSHSLFVIGSVSASPSPTPSVTPSPSPTSSVTPSPSPTPSVTPSPSPSVTPTPSPAQALNISTRMRVDTGSNVLIGGFIISGTAPKNVVVRGIGPSLGAFGVPDALADPTLEVHNSTGALVAQNDNWQDDPSQASQLMALGLALQDPNESAIVATLQPGASYTAILAGKNSDTGVGLVEVYDTHSASASQLANISTRGLVLTGSNVMIGGFILGGNSDTHVVVRGIGPSLAQFGIPDFLADPILELHDGNGALLVSNDNWQDDASASQLTALGLAPQNAAESGIYRSLPPGNFTAILAGTNSGTGIGLVEVYNVQ